MLKEKVARAIRQLKKGKTEYFDEIYDLTRASVYYVIRGVLKDNYLVEDAMQETYVAFLNSIAKIDDEQNPLSYLLQIAKNKALDEARRMTRAAGANIDDVEIATSDVTVSDLPLLDSWRAGDGHQGRAPERGGFCRRLRRDRDPLRELRHAVEVPVREDAR